MMRIILITTTLLFVQFSIAQKKDTIFYDSSWKKTEKENAEYYRIYSEDSSNKQVEVKDFYITGELQMKGSYKSRDFEKEIGDFVWYYKNGNLQMTSYYENGKREDKYVSYYKNSQKESEGSYKKDKKNGVWRYYFESGNLSAEVIYKKDKIVSEKYWNEDGSEMTDIKNANVKAEFPGGNTAFNDLIFRFLKYPEEQLKKKVEGRVVVSFKINKKGEMEEYKIIKSTDEAFSKEALRVFEIVSKKKWTPGKSQNRLVNTWFGIPLNFKN